MKLTPHYYQQNLFSMPNISSATHDIKTVMNQVAKESQYSRELLLDRMNTLADRHNVKLLKGNNSRLKIDTLEKWLNPNDRHHVPSLVAFLVFCAAAGSTMPLAAMGGVVGAQVIDETDSKMLAWAKEYHLAKGARRRMRKIEENFDA